MLHNWVFTCSIKSSLRFLFFYAVFVSKGNLLDLYFTSLHFVLVLCGGHKTMSPLYFRILHFYFFFFGISEPITWKSNTIKTIDVYAIVRKNIAVVSVSGVKRWDQIPPRRGFIPLTSYPTSRVGWRHFRSAMLDNITSVLGALHSFDLHFYLFTALTYIKCNHSKYNSTCPLGTVSINCKHTK